ncbi:MAG: DUF2627 domain-containing protein [Bacillaceae bacterium]|nr:DUF2627 domain-containing protein [Bacillaceae bacterium]
MLFQRIIAVLILVIPGAVSMYGVKIMRDVIFEAVGPNAGSFLWLKFAAGFVFFLGGLAFIAGFLYNREKKLGRLQKKLQRKSNVEEWMKKQNNR